MAESVTNMTSDVSGNKVELSISCTNLKDLDFFSKSDPVVFLFEKRGTHWEKFGRTEMIDNNLNPKFSKTFLLNYQFEEIQELKFVVYDVDDRDHIEDLRRHDLIGETHCTLADIVTAEQQFKRTLRNRGAPGGEIIIVAEEVQDSKYTVHMQLSGTKLDKKDFFGKSDPFFEIAKAQEGGKFTVAYRSKPILKTLDPKWPLFEIPILQLCSGDWDRTLRFSVWDWNRSGDHEIIGSCTTSLREICPERGGQVYNLDLINKDKLKKKKYVNSGVLNFLSVKTTPLHTFVDYIRGGCDINLIVAIDFTASNGKPQNPSSLHYKDPYRDNSYVSAIKSVGSVLAPYDSDQLIPVFGFGARVPSTGEVSHCFPANFNETRPDVFGIEGILEAYHYALSRVELYGPTNFSSFLDRAIAMARSGMTEDSQKYFILLVITDGVISDMKRTVDRIVEASKLPLSIVIVGVGGADFSNMEILDADDDPLRSSFGEMMSRDIVQFVPFRKFASQGGANFSLARETLAEIPDQFLSFMKNKGIKPNPPSQRTRPQTEPAPYPGLNSSSAPYPGSNPSSAPYPGPNPNSAPYPAASNPNSALYPGSNPSFAPHHHTSAPYPRSNPNSGAYPGSNPNSVAYRGSNPNPGAYRGSNPNPGAYRGSNPNPGPYPGSNPNYSNTAPHSNTSILPPPYPL